MWEILSIIAGVLAVGCFLLCYQLKNRKSIITFNVISRVLYIIEYCLIGAFAGAVMDITAIPSSVIASKKNHPLVKKYKIPLIILVNLIIVAIGLFIIFFVENGSMLGLLSIAGVLFETIALWFNSEKTIRIISIFGAPCWFIYNMICGAYPSAFGNVLTVISIIVALVRYKNQKKLNNRACPDKEKESLNESKN